jgi:hypothetical protein
MRTTRLNRDAVLLDELGCVAILTVPAEETAVVMDLGGRLNRAHSRVVHRYAMSPAQAAELVVELLEAGQSADPAEFLAAIDAEIERRHP